MADVLTRAGSLLAALLGPLLDPASRTWWGSLVVFVVFCALYAAHQRPGWTLARLWAGVRHPSTRLDVQLLLARQLIALLRGATGLGGAWVLATGLVRAADAHLGAPAAASVSPTAVVVVYSLALFVGWDLSRYALHRLMHRVPALWALHQVHHSAELLSPLTFHRLHPLESILYQLRGALVTGAITGLFFYLFRAEAQPATLLGVPAAGLVLNMLFGNLRHSHVWLRFPSAVERWLLSPAQHQLHHSAEARHFDTNFGTWLAVWDRVGGTLRSEPAPPEAFGVPAEHRNHGDDLISALVDPVAAALRCLPGRRAALPALVAAALGAGAAARAADAPEPPPDAPPERAVEEGDEGDEGDEGAQGDQSDEGDTFGVELVVYAPDGTPRVAGSAHVVTEKDLETFEYDDIERQLLQVPGVTTRGEDGFGLRPNIGMRGVNSDRSAKLTLMEDGVLLSPAPYAAPAAYYFPMSTRLTGVEVFKGPAATRFGPQTVGGALNLLTRKVPDAPDYAVDVAAGLRQSLRAHAWAGASRDRAGLLVEGVHLQSAGFKELDGGGPTGFDRTELMAKGRLRPGGGHELGVKVGYARERSNETYLGITLADAERTPYRRYAASALGLMTWNRTQAELSWSARPTDQLRVRTVAYHHWLDRAWTKLNRFAGGPDLHDLLQLDPSTGQGAVYMGILRGEEDSASPEQALQIGTNDRTFHAMGVQSTARWNVDRERVGSSLELGLRVHGDVVDRLHTEDPHAMVAGALEPTGEPTLTLLDSRATALAVAAHAHEDLRLDDLHLTPGLRVEAVQTTQRAVGQADTGPTTRVTPLPGVGALYSVNSWLDVFGGSYRGFSPVAPGQDPGVRPEQAWIGEGGARIDTGDRSLEVVGFLTDYSNITGQCTVSGGCIGDTVDLQFNGGAARVYGVESVGRVDLLLPGGLRVPLSATYTFTESMFLTGFVSGFPQFGTVEPGDALPYVPTHQAGGRMGLVHPRAALNVGVAWRTGMLDAAGAFPVSDLDVPALMLVDASVRVQLSRRLEAYVVGTNLTNSTAITSWRPFGARTTAPLQVLGGLKLTPPQRGAGG